MPASRPELSLLPRPTKVTPAPGPLHPRRHDTAVRAPRRRGAADLLRTLLAPATGLPLPPVAGRPFVLALDPQLGGLGDEGYGLTVGPHALLLRAARPDGLLRGVQTIRQLLPPEALSGGRSAGTPGSCRASRSPTCRGSLAGAMLDVARHFQPVSYPAPLRGPPRAAQAQRPASAPDRRPGLAHAGRRLPPAHRGRRAAPGRWSAGRRHDVRPHPARGRYTRAELPGLVRTRRAGRDRRAGDRDAGPCARRPRRLPPPGQPPRAPARRLDPAGASATPCSASTRRCSTSAGPCSTRSWTSSLAVRPHRRRRVPHRPSGRAARRPGPVRGRGAPGPRGAARLVPRPDRRVPPRARPAPAGWAETGSDCRPNSR